MMIRATVTDWSIAHMSAAVAYFADLGIEVIQFEPLSVAGRATEIKSSGCKRPDSGQFVQALKDALSAGERHGVEIVSTAWMNLLQPSCHFCDGIGGNRFVVNYDGSVSGCLEVQNCSHPLKESFIVGHIGPGKEIFLKENKIAEMRNKLITQRNAECVSCFAKPVCAGGCPARNAHRTGDAYYVDPYFCQINKEMLAHLLLLMADENGLISMGKGGEEYENAKET